MNSSVTLTHTSQAEAPVADVPSTSGEVELTPGREPAAELVASTDLPQYLLRRASGHYQFVRRYPHAFVVSGLFKRGAMRLSLGTTNLELAVERRDALCLRFDSVIARLEQRAARRSPYAADRDTGELPANVVRVGDHQHLAQRFAMLLLHSDDEERVGMTTDEIGEYEELLKSERARLALANKARDVSGYTDVVEGFLEAEGLLRPEADAEYLDLCRQVLQKHLTALRIITERLEDGAEHPTPKCWPPLRSEEDLDDIGVAVEHWKRKRAVKPRSMNELMPFLKRFRLATGATRISQLRPESFLLFQESELQRERYNKGSSVKPQTVNKHFVLLGAVIELACSDCLSQRGFSNPMSNLSPAKVSEEDVERTDGFSVEELGRYFSSPVYTQGHRPNRGAGEASYWMPLLGRGTAGRMIELAQAHAKHVVRVDGVWCIWVTKTLDDWDSSEITIQNLLTTLEPSEQDANTHPLPKLTSDSQEVALSLKTGSSKRLIPIHPRLIELGFLRFVAWVHSNGGGRLFPHVLPDSQGRLTAKFSRWFLESLDEQHAKRSSTDWRSFRHLLKSELRAAKAPQEIVEYLIGHVPERVGPTYGQFRPEEVFAVLSTVSLRGLECVAPWSPPQVHFEKKTRRGAGRKHPRRHKHPGNPLPTAPRTIVLSSEDKSRSDGHGRPR